MTTGTNGWDALAKRLDNVKKPVQTFLLCDDADIRDRYQAAKQDAEQADAYLKALPKNTPAEDRAAVEKQAKDAQTELAAAQKAYNAHTVTLRFAALERKQLELLQKQHPATEEDEERGEDWHTETFAPALIAASSLDGMPVEAARTYLDTWAPGDARDLWQAAWTIQHQKRTDLGKG